MTPLDDNEAAQHLAKVGALDPDALQPFHPRTRDRDDIGVYRCARTGVIVLSTSAHVDDRFYPDKEHPALQALGERERVVASLDEDTQRRATTFGHLVTNRRWLDVGTGAGAILDRLRERAARTGAVEPQGQWRAALSERGYEVWETTQVVPDDAFDVATLFHVFEHFPRPLDELHELERVLVEDGQIVIEVPHARDALIDLFHSSEFRAHTFWSEHLVLHTRESLRRMLEATGFDDVRIEAVQRYPVANHLHWLSHGRPGGHQVWSMLRDDQLDQAYGATLSRLDATDTLVAYARRAPRCTA